MPFAEVWKEFAAEEGQCGARDGAEHGDGGDDESWPARDALQAAALALLEPALQPGLGVLGNTPPEDEQGEGGRHRERHGE